MNADERKASVLAKVKARKEAKAAAKVATATATAAAPPQSPAGGRPPMAPRAGSAADGMVDDTFSDSDEEAELRQLYTPTTKPKQAPQRPEDVGLAEAMQLGGLRITEAEQAAARAPSARATAIREAAAAEARERAEGGKGGAVPVGKSGGGCCAIM